jgi:Flp pilus assembly protein TadG
MRNDRVKRQAQRGHAMLELAISASVMVACLTGTFQFGYTFYVYNQLVTATGNGARYASMRPRSGDPEADKAAVRNMVVFGEARPAAEAAPVVAGLKPEQVAVNYDDAAQTVRVSIGAYKVNAIFTSFDFAGRPSVEFPYIGDSR